MVDRASQPGHRLPRPDVRRQVFGGSDTTQARQERAHGLRRAQLSYDYLVLLQGSDDEFLLNESRLADAHNQQRNKKNVPLLITNGFSMLMLIFHPYYRNSFEFRRCPTRSSPGIALPQVRFTHIRGNAHPGGAGGARTRVSPGIDRYSLDRSGESDKSRSSRSAWRRT